MVKVSTTTHNTWVQAAPVHPESACFQGIWEDLKGVDCIREIALGPQLLQWTV